MQLGVWDLCSDIFHVNHFGSVSSWGCSLFVSFLRLTTGAKLSQQPLLVVILKKAKKKLHFGTCFIFGCLKKLVLGYLLSLKICKARLERPSRVWFRWFSKPKKTNVLTLKAFQSGHSLTIQQCTEKRTCFCGSRRPAENMSICSGDLLVTQQNILFVLVSIIKLFDRLLE